MVDGGVEDEGEAAGADGAQAPEELAQDAHPGKREDRVTISVARGFINLRKYKKNTSRVMIATPTPPHQKRLKNLDSLLESFQHVVTNKGNQT